MSLQYFVETVPEGQENLYKSTDNGFVLDVDGVVPETTYKETKQKVDEFRTSNISLKQQLEALSGTKTEGPDITVLVEQEVQSRLTDLKKERDSFETKIKEKDAQLEQVILSDGVKEAAIKYGVHESAVQDVLNRARETFSIKDGKAVSKSKAVDSEGKDLTINSWIQLLAEGAPHLFVKSSGAGALKSKGGSAPIHRSSTDKISAGLSKL